MALSFEEAVEDAMSTVRLVPRWQLAPDQWPAAEAALQQLQAAVESGRAPEVRRAQEALEDLGPTRLGAILRSDTAAAPPRDPPPAAVLELVNTLVHPTGGWSTPGRPAAPAER